MTTPNDKAMGEEGGTTMIRQRLIRAGVANLKEFGYPYVNEENILTDMVYSRFFASMLKDNKGRRQDVDTEIDKLLTEIEKEP